MPQEPSDLFRVGLFSGFPVGPNDVLVCPAQAKVQDLVPNLFVHMVSQLRSFKHLADHAKDFWKNLSWRDKIAYRNAILDRHSPYCAEIYFGRHGSEKMLGKILEKLAEKHLLVSLEEFLTWAAQSGDTAHSISRIASIGVVTRDRSESLKQCLESYIKCCVRWQRSIDFLAFDDSGSAETQQRNRLLLSDMAQEFKVPILYGGLQEKRNFAQSLVKIGVPSEVLDFALFDSLQTGQSYGANRNAFLLHSIGDLVFSVDDDTLGQMGRSPNWKDAIKIGVEGAIYEMWSYADRASALNSITPEDRDILGVHEALLGKGLGQIISEQADPNLIDCNDIPLFLFRAIQKGEGEVVVTLPGLIGDSGSRSYLPWIFSAGAQRERLLKSAAAYREATQGREICKSVGKVVIQPAASCMTTFLGIDNRSILPPFFPIYRNEDATLGHILQKCSPSACFGYVPWICAHVPQNNSSLLPTSTNSLEIYWPHAAIFAALQTFSTKPLAQDRATNLRELGEHFKYFGSLPFAEYREILLEIRLGEIAIKIKNLEDVLMKYPKSPVYWVRDVKGLIAQARKESQMEIILAPEPLIRKCGKEKAQAVLQNLIYRYGELLCWWPDIVQAAKDLRQKGIRLAQPVCRHVLHG